MGYGDEIMAAGQAQRAYDRDPQKRRVAICDRQGHVRWHELWQGNPIIATPQDVANGVPVTRIRNGVGCRPYLRELTVERGAKFATDWRSADNIGRIYLTDEERALGRALRAELGSFVVVEPGAKLLSCKNKAWGRERYAAVVEALPEVRWVQMAHEGAAGLEGVRVVSADTFRMACGVIAEASGYLGPEGGLHHAAAALGIPAVVIFGGFISPDLTGYPLHINIADDGPGSPCGTWRPCEHCRKAHAKITPARVTAAVQQLLARDARSVA